MTDQKAIHLPQFTMMEYRETELDQLTAYLSMEGMDGETFLLGMPLDFAEITECKEAFMKTACLMARTLIIQIFFGDDPPDLDATHITIDYFQEEKGH